MPMDDTQARAIAGVCLHAALCDGSTAQAERQGLDRVFSMLDEQGRGALYQQVVMGSYTLEQASSSLTGEAERRMAYDMAVGVCEADGATSDAERSFLDQLRGLLSIDKDHADAALSQGDQLAEELEHPQTPSADDPPAMPVPSTTAAPAVLGVSTVQPTQLVDPIADEVDGMVLRYAILNGAIELLPQNLATVAILPLQMKMVYRIGKRYGHELSAGHIKEFLGVIGVGMTSQVLEGYARKLLGTLAGKALGKTAGKLASKAAGPAMTFATTYALGQVARQYYAGGRTLSAIDLKGMYQRSADRGRELYQQHAPQVTQQASSLDMMKVMDLVRGKQAV